MQGSCTTGARRAALSPLLCDMTAKAVRVRDAADSQLSDLLGELEATHGYHTPQVRCVA